MAGVVKGMEGAMRAMDLEKVPILSKFFIYTPFTTQHLTIHYDPAVTSFFGLTILES